MKPFDRKVRAEVYRLMVGGAEVVDVETISSHRGWEGAEVAASLRRLQDGHLLGLVGDSDRVQIANPFSGVPTVYSTFVGQRRWFANCAWDGLAILAVMGDGEMHRTDTGLVWKVSGGTVEPDGFVHFLVPASRFWDDIAFT